VMIAIKSHSALFDKFLVGSHMIRAGVKIIEAFKFNRGILDLMFSIFIEKLTDICYT
jgi:hypothetical protein